MFSAHLFLQKRILFVSYSCDSVHESHVYGIKYLCNINQYIMIVHYGIEIDKDKALQLKVSIFFH